MLKIALFRTWDGAFGGRPPGTRPSQPHPGAVPLPQGGAAEAPVPLVLTCLTN